MLAVLLRSYCISIIRLFFNVAVVTIVNNRWLTHRRSNSLQSYEDKPKILSSKEKVTF